MDHAIRKVGEQPVNLRIEDTGSHKGIKIMGESGEIVCSKRVGVNEQVSRVGEGDQAGGDKGCSR